MKAGIYVHIPFCLRKCNYCDFASSVHDRSVMLQYASAIKREIKEFANKLTDCQKEIDTIFIGGGTPTVFPENELVHILSVIRENFFVSPVAEITIEANPKTVTWDKLKAYQNAGINRISIGLQSADDEELKMLGRIHNFEDFLRTYEMVRASGFDNVNVDLISGIPNQNWEKFLHTLESVIKLSPEHISAYSLIVEEGTPFYQRFGEGMPEEDLLPGEEEDRRIYHNTERILRQSGYERYEISNYSKKGYACKHNLKYWNLCDYYGFGVSAASKVGNIRFTNDWDIYKYMEFEDKPPRREEECLTKDEQMSEFMFLGLRTMAGISYQEFEKRFCIPCKDRYGDVIDKFIRTGFLEEQNGTLRLTERGIDVSNRIFVEFL